MPGHDIVVVGASAGGVEPLKRLVDALPTNFQGSLFVVLHTNADSPGYMASVLTHRGNLTAHYPKDGTRIQKGRIYIAPPDHHMLLERRCIRITRGPKENRARPAIDPLFRSAAWTYGPRVIGIILSGTLDDGVSGLWAVKQSGGITIVQDPDEALFSDMPLNASRVVDIDYTLRIEQIARLLTRLVKKQVRERRRRRPKHLKLESDFAMMRGSVKDMGKLGKPSGFACPTCHGAMWEMRDGSMVRYRCHVGHAFSPESLIEEQSEALENALYEALKAIEEKGVALRRLANQYGSRRPKERVAYEARANKADKNAKIIRELIAKREM